MKKLLTKILTLLLVATIMLSVFAGCSSSASWEGTKMTGWGNDVAGEIGGFMVEKENYYYFINGVGSNLEKNDFGAPVKGALMAVDKNDFSKKEIVVPKLFVASDYTAGLYIYGDYVYYGTPNTDLDSSGEVAVSELTFMKTKLDGTGTKKFFTLTSLSAQYRIVKAGDDVLIVYYDADDTALKAFNCTTETTAVIAKTDAEVAGKNGESLENYMFTENGSEIVVYYTTTVYAEEYNENKTDERATESYNKVYAYKAGDDVSEQVAVLDGGKVTPNTAKYAMKLAKFGELFYTEEINGESKMYVGFGNEKTRVYNEDVIANTSLFILDQNEGLQVYTLDSGKIIKNGVTANYNSEHEVVALASDASTLLDVKDGKIYFTDTAGGISRIKLNDDKANVENVTDYSAYTSWYPVKFVGEKMFYCDNSSQGGSYIKYVDVTSTVFEEDTDDDGEMDKFYLKGQTTLGVITDADQVSMATALVNDISNKLENGALPFETKDGKLVVPALDEVLVAVEGVELSDATKELLANYKKAVEMANLYNKLDGIFLDNADKPAFKASYNEIKAQIEAFRKDRKTYDKVSPYITQNLLASYDRAVELFEGK